MAENDHRFTPPVVLRLAAELVGLDQKGHGRPVWDLDAAAHFESHHGRHWFAPAALIPGGPAAAGDGWLGTDGLALPWWGHVFVNPPFGDLEAWISRAWNQAFHGGAMMDGGWKRVDTIVMVLPWNRQEQPFWQRWVEPFRERPFHPRPHEVNQTFGGEPPPRVDFSTHAVPGRHKFTGPGGVVPESSPRWPIGFLLWKVIP